MKKLIVLFLAVAAIGCSSAALSVGQATSLIDDYIEQYPYFEKTNFKLGKQKFSVKKDAEEISLLKDLAANDFISLTTIEKNKKLFSKDSVLILNVGLTAKASDFVVEQKKNTAQVKTFLFTLQENSDVQLELNGNTKATATAKLIKKPTPFAGLAKDKNANSEFITQKFVLKYKQETGWYVQK